MKTIEPFYQELGRHLRVLRMEAGMTQEELGSQLNPPMTRAAIANIETGKQRVLALTLAQLAAALDKEVNDLIPPQRKKLKPIAGIVEAELAEKLNLPTRELKKLTTQLHPTSSKRKK